MGLSDTAADTGSDKGHQHQHRHSKHHHHRHKHDHHGNGSSSSDYKHKHKHRHHRHRHHKHHGHKKHRRHKSKVDVDKAAIENALKLLEADALEAVKDQVATELNPETVELMLAAGTSESASEDSSSGSGSEEGDATATAVGETTATAVGGTTATAVGGTATAAVGEIATAAVGEIAAAAVETTSSVVQTVRITKTQPLASDSAPSDSIPSEEGTESGSALARESGTLVSSCQDGKTDSDTLHSVAVGDEPHSSSKLESESDSEDDSESDIAFGTPKLSSGPRNSKTIRIKIHRTTLPGREKEDYSLSALSSTRGPKSNDGTDTEFESSRETKTIRTGDSKITYVNLKAKSLDSEGRKADGSSKVPFGKSTASEDEELRSSSPEGRGKERERRKRSLKRSSRHHRSRSRSRSRSQSRSRSRSPRAGQHRHRSHKYHYSQSKSQSRSRSRSPHSRRRSSRYRRSRSRSRSRSGRHRCSRSRSYTRHRTKSRSRSRSRSHSRSRRRCSRRRRYSRSSSRRRSPRRRRSYYRSRSRSPYRSRRRRHSSRSRSRSRRRSRSHSRSRSRSQSRSSSRGRNREQEKPASKASVVTAISTAAAAIEATVADLTDPKKAHIAQLTAFCQELQVKQAQEEAGAEEGETEWGGAESEPQLRAPFELNPAPAYQPGLIFHNNAWKTANQIAAEMDARIDEKPVEEKFPVSSGLPHRSTTGNIPGVLNVSESIFARTQPVSVGDLVAKRLEATHRLQQNPADYEAHQTLAHIEQQTKQWAQSKIKLGQFTGEASLTAMSSKEHNIGQQAWAKKDMFFRLAPVMGGVGMKMMMKMGWRAGQPLGKKGEGHVEPISVQVKVNRSGLSTVTDKQPPVVPATSLQALDARGAHLVQGKHPVSALQEICSKKKWDPPHYEMVDVSGPAHKKTFLFRVTVPLGTFQPAVASNNKKVAKAQAALAALQGLGLASGSVEYSAS